MDPSALIFVALAVAWAVYLIPKALEHHEEGLRSRTVSTFSHTLRVLARREPVDRRNARLVTSAAAATKRNQVDVGIAPEDSPGADAEEGLEATAVLPPLTDIAAVLNPSPRRRESPAAARRRATMLAARRRRRVLVALLALVVLGGALDYVDVVSRLVALVPVVLVVAWLVACRLMVRREHGGRARIPVIIDRPAEPEPATEPEGEEAVAASPAVATAPVAGVSWDPVDVPLPTYVSKPAAAPREVRTLDLDETGVWSSGRNAADSALAREADAARAVEAEQAAERADHERRRAAGS